MLDRVSLEVSAGELVSVLGPNGAGKSTLINVMAGDIKASAGNCWLNGQTAWPRLERARMLGVLPQVSALSFPFTAEEVVLLGRLSCGGSRRSHLAIVRQALQQVDALSLQNRLYTRLSEGEKQRIHIARVLSQLWDPAPTGARFLLLDEPLSAQDPAHQQQLLQLLRTWAGSAGMGVVLVLHDLNLAARYSDRLLLLKEGQQVAEGTPGDILTADTIRAVFAIEASILEHPSQPCPLVVPG